MVSLMKAIEAGADCRGYRDQFAQPGTGPQSHREPGRDAAKAPATPPSSTTTGCSSSRSTSTRSGPRYTGIPLQHHRRGNRDLRQPDSRRHDLQHGEPVEAAGRRRPPEGSAGGSSAVRKDAGYPPLVTPSSQIVGTQAVFNVMMGRYKVLTGEFADLMLGYYGETIGRARPAADRAGRQADQEGPDRHPSGRPAEAGVAGTARRRARRSRAATAPTKTC